MFFRKTSRPSMVPAILAVMLTVAAAAGLSEASELAAGLIKDTLHEESSKGAIVRYDDRRLRLGAHLMMWRGSSGTNGAVAGEYNFLRLGPVDLDAGVGYLLNATEINGTRANFSLTAAGKAGEHLRLQFTHFSNGQKIFNWALDYHNLGWNFIAVMYVF